MIRRALVLGVTLACSTIASSADAQSSALAWPAITRDTKPWTRWWWLGSAVDKSGLSAQIAELSRAGFGGVEVTVIYGAKGAESKYIPYLTTQWVDMIAHTAAETHRFGMGLDLPQGSGWRIGGPNVPPADVNTSLTVRVDTNTTGEMRYTAVTRFSGDNVKRPAPGGEGPSIDPFSATATANYLAYFAAKTASLPRGAIRSYFHDSFEYTGDASAGLFDVFAKRRGYSLSTELPALTGRGDPDHVARVQSDYRQTLDEMLLENSVQQLTRWSHERGSLMREQAHGSPGNLLDLYGASDIPETEIFGVLRGPDTDPLINMFASSAAHVTGKRLASAESFTWLGEHFSGTLDEVKQAADRMFLAGINHLIYHGTAYSPSTAPWPGWQFYASMEFNPRNAFWRDLTAFNTYVARVQSILQSGEPDNDVLLYWPIWDSWHDVSRRRMDFRVHDPAWFHSKPFGALGRALHESSYGVDYVSDRQLTSHITVDGGRLRATSGSYSAVVVPASQHMPPETFARLVALARDGATVIFAGALPTDVPGLARLAERRAELASAVQGIVFGAPVGGVRTATVGRGRILAGDALEPLLAAAGVRRDPLADDKSLEIIRRRTADGPQYFAVATKRVDQWLPVQGNPASVVLMDPMDGRTGLAQLRRVGGRTEMLVQLDSGASLVLRTFARRIAGAEWPYARAVAAPVALAGKWSVSFTDGGPVLPRAFSSDSAGAWTGRGDDDADRFAGTVTYRLSFDAPDDARRHLLALGRVAESARIRLNGRALGVRFAAPWALETGPLRRKGNVLEVEVTNVSANRVRDLDRRGVQWRTFHDINFVGIDYKPFDASKWPVRMSGLLGPVTLQALK